MPRDRSLSLSRSLSALQQKLYIELHCQIKANKEMGRAPCCDKSKVKKGPWSAEEDIKLKEFIDRNGTGGNWISLPQKAGLKRCGKSCRLRWLNYLRPNIKHGDFSDAEDRIICSLFATIGSRWSIIAAQLPGRTDNDIKNYWNTKLKKKLLGIPACQRKLNQQMKKQQQLIFPSSISYDIAPTTSSSSSLMSNPLNAQDNYQMGNMLMFGGHEQSSSSSRGLEFGSTEDMGFGDNFIYSDDFVGSYQSFLPDAQDSSSLGFHGNYEEMKHLISQTDSYSSIDNLGHIALILVNESFFLEVLGPDFSVVSQTSDRSLSALSILVKE